MTMEGILIPGLPNDLSLQILARVPRRYYSQMISKVSSSWSQAVTSPQLFTLRKQLGMTESWDYVAVKYHCSMRWFAKNTTSGYSQCWALPLMREDHRPIFGFCCAAIGERLFVMGGCEWKRDCTKFAATNKVSVFNARTNEWSRVQSMKYARARFGCGVVDGKIYVAGGYRFILTGDDSDDEDDYHKYHRFAEVYNPLTDEWTPVADMMRTDFCTQVSVIQGKFVVRGYLIPGNEIVQAFHAEENRWVKFRSVEEDEMENHETSSSMSLYEISDDTIDFLYRSTTTEGIDEDDEECDEMGSVTACVMISI